MLNLKKYNEIVREVREANEGVENHVILAIASIIYKNERNVEVESLDVMLLKLWKWNDSKKARSNTKAISEALEQIIYIAEQIVSKHGTNPEFLTNKYYGFVKKMSRSVVATNKFGRKLGYSVVC